MHNVNLWVKRHDPFACMLHNVVRRIGSMSIQENPATPEWDLADRLRKALRQADVGVQDMADELGLSRNSVSHYLSGRKAPKRSVLVTWALRCGVPVTWIETGDMPSRAPDGGGGLLIDRSGWFSGTAPDERIPVKVPA